MGNHFCINYLGIGTREFVVKDDISGQDQVAYDILIKFLTQKQINRLWTCYCEIDIDGGGSISADEFRSYLSLEKGKLNEKLFGCFDADNSGYLNFFEFTCALWNFLSTDVHNLGGFIFYLFDDDKSGSLDFMEIKKIIEIIHAQDLNKSGHLSDKINSELANKPSYLVLDDFQKWTRSKPMLTNPLLTMQLKLQGDLIGTSFWKEISAQRNEDPEKIEQKYIFNEIARADAIYQIHEKRRRAQENIDKKKGSVLKTAAGIGKRDEKAARRDSLVLGMMNLKQIVAPVKQRRETKFDTEKYRDKNDIKFDGPDSKKKKTKTITATTLSDVLGQDDAVFVESLDGPAATKTKPVTPSGGGGKKKGNGRSTIAIVGGDTLSSSPKESDKDKPKRADRPHRSTIVIPKNSSGPNSPDKGKRAGRATVISAKAGSLPPIKT